MSQCIMMLARAQWINEVDIVTSTSIETLELGSELHPTGFMN
jgi:hypothetical protein